LVSCSGVHRQGKKRFLRKGSERFHLTLLLRAAGERRLVTRTVAIVSVTCKWSCAMKSEDDNIKWNLINQSSGAVSVLNYLSRLLRAVPLNHYTNSCIPWNVLRYISGTRIDRCNVLISIPFVACYESSIIGSLEFGFQI